MKTAVNLTVTLLLVTLMSAFTFASYAFALIPADPASDEATPAEEDFIEEEPTSLADPIPPEVQPLPAPVENRFEEVEQKRIQIQEEVQNRVETVQERKSQLEAKSQERVINLAANMSNRMDAIIERLQDIIERIGNRVNKLSEAGLDTQEAENALMSAQMSLDEAKAEIAYIDVAVEEAVTSEDVKAAWEEVKSKYQTIKDHIKTTHTELRVSVQALKDAAEDTREDDTENAE